MMQCKIPPAMREQLSQDVFMLSCIFHGTEYGDECSGRIEWQHAMTYAGKRVNELYTILPLCHAHHVHQAELRDKQEFMIVQRIKHFNAEADFRKKFPRSTLLV